MTTSASIRALVQIESACRALPLPDAMALAADHLPPPLGQQAAAALEQAHDILVELAAAGYDVLTSPVGALMSEACTLAVRSKVVAFGPAAVEAVGESTPGQPEPGWR